MSINLLLSDQSQNMIDSWQQKQDNDLGHFFVDKILDHHKNGIHDDKMS